MTEKDLHGVSALHLTQSLIAKHWQKGKKWCMVVRHGERPRLIPGSGADVNLTENGKQEARALGAFIANLNPKCSRGATLYSPYVRCKETLECILEGLGFDNRQGVNSEIILRFSPAHDPVIKQYGPFDSFVLFASNQISVDGVGKHKEWYQRYAEFIKKTINEQPDGSLSILTSHDDVTLSAVAGLFGMVPVDLSWWLGFLEGIFFWVDSSGEINAAFRSLTKCGI